MYSDRGRLNSCNGLSRRETNWELTSPAQVNEHFAILSVANSCSSGDRQIVQASAVTPAAVRIRISNPRPCISSSRSKTRQSCCTIHRTEIGRTFTAPMQDHQLAFQKQRFCYHGTTTALAHQILDSAQQVHEQDGHVTHCAAIATISTGMTRPGIHAKLCDRTGMRHTQVAVAFSLLSRYLYTWVRLAASSRAKPPFI